MRDKISVHIESYIDKHLITIEFKKYIFELVIDSDMLGLDEALLSTGLSERLINKVKEQIKKALN